MRGGWRLAQGSGAVLRPTAAGWSLLVVVAVLVLMAINEANNLLYALAFVLLSVWLVGAVQAWHNLAGLALRALEAAPVMAGEAGPLRLQLVCTGRQRHALELQAVDADGAVADVTAAQPLHLAQVAAQAPVCELSWRAARRGWQTLAAVQVRSSYPLGLAQAQRRLPVSIRRLVWPQPVAQDHAAARASAAHHAEEADQFTGLSPWRAGDSPRRLAWKAMARAGAPMVKRFDGADGHQAMSIDWRDTEGDTEQRLAVLTRRVLDAEQRRMAWRLVMPGRAALPQGPGPVALQRALAALALHGLDGAAEVVR